MQTRIIITRKSIRCTSTF